MPNINKSALVSYSAEQMYKLVNDVQSYQNFLPGCRYSEVLSESEAHMEAKMVLVKAGIEQTLVTSNALVENRSITMSLAQGPFKALSGGWTFTPLSDEACKIELSLDFTFSSKLVDMAFGKVFRSVTANMVNAFSQRAKAGIWLMSGAQIEIQITYALPTKQTLLSLHVPAGTRVEQAIEQSGILLLYSDIDLNHNKVGIWYKTTKLDAVLQQGDRIEIYRPMTADPKEVRKLRALKAKEEGRANKITGAKV